MTPRPQRSKSPRPPLSLSSGWPLLLMGGSLLIVSNGRWIFPLAAWLTPVLLMRYIRTSPKLWKGLLALWTLHFLAVPISWIGLWPFPPLVMAQIAATGALLSLVPYVMDRLSLHRLGRLTQTLVFPCTAVALEFLGSLRSHSTWGNLAYTQTGNLPLLQFASVAGIWGITFLMLWLAPILNNLWQEGWSHGKVRAGAVTYALALALVLGFGSARLIFFAPSGDYLRVATVTPPELVDLASPEGQEFFRDFQQIFTKQTVAEETLTRVRDKIEALQDPLFEATRRQARAGAGLVVWPEAGLISFNDDQDRSLIERGQELAKEEEIYLGFTIAKVPVEAEHLNENRLLLIDPSGEILETYWKHQTVPVVEEPFAVPGSSAVLAEDTTFGTLGGVICYDMDSPRFLRGGGRRHLDLLMAPSGDWPAIKEIHPRMAILRAVEQGTSLVRPANHGLNLAADYQGRILARLDHYTTEDRQMVAWLPRQGTSTLYTRLGDVLPWTCVILSSVFAAWLLWQTVASRRPLAAHALLTPENL